MVFQSYALYPNMNVAREHRLRRWRCARCPRRERDAARAARGRDAADRPPARPQARRSCPAASASAWRWAGRWRATRKLFLFDEPLSNLDAKLRVEMRAEIKLLHQRTSTTTVYVTHDQVEAMTLGDRIAVMKDGVVQQFGTPDDIYSRPATRFVAEFIGSPAMNMVAASARRRRAGGAGRRPAADRRAQRRAAAAAPASVVYGLRPENLGFADSGLPGTLTMIEPTGPETYVTADTAIGKLTARVPGPLPRPRRRPRAPALAAGARASVRRQDPDLHIASTRSCVDQPLARLPLARVPARPHPPHPGVLRPPRLDASGGFFQFFKDDGTVYDRRTRHLVSSTRFVFNHAMALPPLRRAPSDQAGARATAWASCTTAHAQPQGGYAWQLDWRRHGRATVQDGTNHCYGLAFVLLAHAHALMAGVEEARAGLDATWQLMEQRFWEPRQRPLCRRGHAGLAASARYRGQNANMHACEAMIAAYDATREPQVPAARADAGRIRHAAPGRAGRRPGVGALPRADGVVGRLGLQPRRQDQHLPPLGLPDRPPDRVGQAADAARSAPPRGRAAGLDRAARAPLLRHRDGARLGRAARRPGLRLRARTARCATATSTSGCRPRASPPRRCWPCAPATRATGTGTTASGPTPGSTSSTTSTAPGTASSRPTTRKLNDEKSPAGKTDYHTMGACHDVLEHDDLIPAPQCRGHAGPLATLAGYVQHRL